MVQFYVKRISKKKEKMRTLHQVHRNDNVKNVYLKNKKKLEDSIMLKYSQSVAPGLEEFIAQVLSILTNDKENEKITDHIQYYLGQSIQEWIK